MLSARSFARAAPRAIGRLASATSSTTRSSIASSLYKPSTLRIATSVRVSPFSSTSARKAATDGETDDELSAKLESEIQIEEDMKSSQQQPASVKDFLDNSPFELVDTEGQELVKLVREFGQEKITVSFSIADITNYDPYSEDPALEDEELADPALQNSNKQSHVQSSGGARSAPAEEQMEEDMEEDMEGDEAPAPINLSIVVEKPSTPNAGALNIDATVADGAINVENMFFYADPAVAKAESPDAAQKRSEVYPGPPFGSLDDDLQVLMERFLEERGVNSAMAIFVPDYVDVKEQREYLRWLNSVKGFIDA
jgi:complement component 1 Q subcomponent-binding protein